VPPVDPPPLELPDELPPLLELLDVLPPLLELLDALPPLLELLLELPLPLLELLLELPLPLLELLLELLEEPPLLELLPVGEEDPPPHAASNIVVRTNRLIYRIWCVSRDLSRRANGTNSPANRIPPGNHGVPGRVAAVVRAVVVTVSVDVEPVATEAGVKLQLAPVGKLPQLRDTVPL
jgi:hypothetical protein